MTEKSLFWYTNGFTGDTGDGAAPYTQEEFRLFNHAWAARNQANVGVFPGVLNELAVSGSTSPLSVATGRAIVYGFPHWADASVSLAVTTPSVGTTGGRVVLRANWTTQQVRATVILNTDGTASIPGMTQSAGSIWDIPLATFTITTGGVITLTDVREWALGGKVTRSFFVPCVGTVNLTDATYYDGIGDLGVILTDNKYVGGVGFFNVPSDFESNMTAVTLVRPAANGNIYATSVAKYGANGEDYANHSDSIGFSAVALSGINDNHEILSLALSSVALGDYVSLQLIRDATHASDTINNTVYLAGWAVTYTAQPLAATA